MLSKLGKIVFSTIGTLFLFIVGLLVLADYGDYIDLGLFREDGEIYINGSIADDSLDLKDIIDSAQSGDIIEISGTVYTLPVDIWTSDITVTGIGDDPKIKLKRGYWADINNQDDLLTLNASGTVISDLTVDAGFRLDHPIRLLFSSNVTLTNVTTRRGTRSGLDILNGNNNRFINVTATDSWQCGVCINSHVDGDGLYFENVVTRGNQRAGVMLRNCYGNLTNIDLSGITVTEGTWSTEYRHGGGLWADGEHYVIEVTHPPVNKQGNVIEMKDGKEYNVERNYDHIRYGKRDERKRIFFMF